MRVNIQPQWHNISNWYWHTPQGQEVLVHRGMSIWSWLQEHYGVQQLYDTHPKHPGTWARFPNDAMYTAFLLRWS